MLMNRIIGAFTFRKGVYAEVESDTAFTQTAWLIVAVVAFLSALGSAASGGPSFVNWLLGAVLAAVFAVVGFAVAAWVVSWVGQALFKADTNFSEVVRTLGLAYVWNVVGFLGIVGMVSGLLTCITAPIAFIAWILGLVAWFVALKEALDLDWTKTIVTAIAGWFAMLIIVFIGGLILGAIGVAVGGVLSIFGR
jgi:hypothetical protein